MIILYGIKNCDSVKKAREWLEYRGVKYQFHDFREHGLSEPLVKTWVALFGLDTLVNKRSTTYRELDESDKDKLNESATAIQLILKQPTLIKRPILDTGRQLTIGFSEENYSQLI